MPSPAWKIKCAVTGSDAGVSRGGPSLEVSGEAFEEALSALRPVLMMNGLAQTRSQLRGQQRRGWGREWTRLPPEGTSLWYGGRKRDPMGRWRRGQAQITEALQATACHGILRSGPVSRHQVGFCRWCYKSMELAHPCLHCRPFSGSSLWDVLRAPSLRWPCGRGHPGFHGLTSLVSSAILSHLDGTLQPGFLSSLNVL